MPTYEYACTKCGHQFEAFQSFSEDALTQCPECKGEVQKVYSNVGVVFKGSGFYKTDSRSTTPAKTESKPEVKTESKPASKPENKSKNKTD